MDENRAFRHVGLESVRPKDRRHGGFGRDEGRFLGKGLQGPDVAPHFHQRDLRPAAPRRLDRLADVARVVNQRVQFVQRGQGALQLSRNRGSGLTIRMLIVVGTEGGMKD